MIVRRTVCDHFNVQTDMDILNIMGGSPGDVDQVPMTKVKQRKGWRMSYDVGKATEGLENEV